MAASFDGRPIVVWVDSDPRVAAYADRFHASGFQLRFCPEIDDAIQLISPLEHDITCIITSTMRRGGRQERGLKDGFDLASLVMRLYGHASYKPLLAFITLTADEQVVCEHGFTIYQRGDHGALISKVITTLTTCDDRDFRTARALNKCGLHMLSSSREALDQILQPAGCSFGAFHDAFSDLCFCNTCQPAQTLQRGGELYSLPTGWMGFGIHLRDDIAINRAVMETWPVVYHGFRPDVLHSMLVERRIMFPGDVLKNGQTLAVSHGQCYASHFGGKPVIYLSPTANYASFPLYARPTKVTTSKGVMLVQVVMQCRIRPGSYKKFPETVHGPSKHVDPDIAKSTQFDPNISNDEVEWLTAEKDAVVPYRVLVRLWDTGAV